jgi:DNA polymerase III epsilon subunit-like protein
MNYLAFDIEAANGYQLSSICSIGVVIADANFNVIHRENIWINPKTKYNLNGTRKNVGIDLHLDKKLLASSPDFKGAYSKIKELLSAPDTLVIGHAVDSDVRMLNAACERYKLKSLNFKFLCTQLLYKLFKGEKEVKALGKIAAELELNFTEHNSEDDAWMSLKTLEFLVKQTGLSPLELAAKYSVRMGDNTDFVLTRPVSLLGSENKHLKVTKELAALKDYCKTVKVTGNKYKGKVFALARSLELMDSSEAKTVLRTIISEGGRYSVKLNKANSYVYSDTKTDQDLLREKRVDELIALNLMTTYNREDLIGAAK